MKLAVIPARGGSKRIPRKNVKSFAGRPMIAYAIEAARASGCFDRILVSTDDEEIAQVAVAYGAEVPFRRPASLADDHTPTVPVVAHAITEMASLDLPPPVDVCCIYPGVPLLAPSDLARAYGMLRQAGSAYVFPVIAFPSAIQRALKRRPDGLSAPFHPEYADTRTQDLERAYYDAGQFYWGSAETWAKGLALHTNALTIVVPGHEAIDIDTPGDWHRAEALYALLKRRR